MTTLDQIVETVGQYQESVDMLLKAIADADSNAFSARIVMLRGARKDLDSLVESILESGVQ